MTDTQHERSKAVLVLPERGRFSKLGLASEDDGSFILTAQPVTGSKWAACRFRIKGDKVVWKGTAHGSGKLIDDPIRTNTGIIVPVLQNDGPQRMVSHSVCSLACRSR